MTLLDVCVSERSNSSWSLSLKLLKKEMTYVVNSKNYVSNILTAVRWVDQSAIDVDQLTLNWLHILMVILSSSLQYGWSTRSHFYQMKRRMIESFFIGRDRFSLTDKIRTIYLTENSVMTTLIFRSWNHHRGSRRYFWIAFLQFRWNPVNPWHTDSTFDHVYEELQIGWSM